MISILINSDNEGALQRISTSTHKRIVNLHWMCVDWGKWCPHFRCLPTCQISRVQHTGHRWKLYHFDDFLASYMVFCSLIWREHLDRWWALSILGCGKIQIWRSAKTYLPNPPNWNPSFASVWCSWKKKCCQAHKLQTALWGVFEAGVPARGFKTLKTLTTKGRQ